MLSAAWCLCMDHAACWQLRAPQQAIAAPPASQPAPSVFLRAGLAACRQLRAPPLDQRSPTCKTTQPQAPSAAQALQVLVAKGLPPSKPALLPLLGLLAPTACLRISHAAV